jgi:hypothetical protein
MDRVIRCIAITHIDVRRGRVYVVGLGPPFPWSLSMLVGGDSVSRAVRVDAVGASAMVGVAATPLGSFRLCPLVAWFPKQTRIWRLAVDTSSDTPQNRRINAALANEIGAYVAEFTGRGATRSRAFVDHDVVVCLLEDSATRGERNLVAAGKADLVRLHATR